MRFRFFTCTLTVVLLVACSDSGRQPNQASQQAQNNEPVKKKPPSSFQDTLTIELPSAVFFNPDSSQLEKFRAVTNPGPFESTVHDCFYQMRNARMVLKEYWPTIKIVETSKARYLLFVKTDKSKVYVDLDGRNDLCGLFLFNRVKNPQLVDMMNINTALEYYFNR
jgi:hypothetical protein